MRLLIFCLVFACGTIALAEQTEEATKESATKKETTSIWMQRKMDYSKAILAGLASGDFEKLEKHSQQLRLLNKVEGFVRRSNAGYRDHVRTFERVCDQLVRQSRKKNLEGATLAFNQLTISCVRCHQSLRADKSIATPQPTTKD